MGPTETIGQRIRQVREQSKLSQKAFGERVGLSQTGVTALENEKSAPRLGTLTNIATAFAINFDWLHTGIGQPKGTPAPKAAIEPDLLLAEEPAAVYGCVAPDLVVTLTKQLVEAHTRIVELETELRDERKQARQDLRSQAALYNSVKVDQSALIDRLYAKLDEYELRLGYRQPTQEEAERMQLEPRPVISGFTGQRYSRLLEEVAAEVVEAKHFYLPVAA